MLALQNKKGILNIFPANTKYLNILVFVLCSAVSYFLKNNTLSSKPLKFSFDVILSYLLYAS